MKFDFTQDKRLMQDAAGTGGTSSNVEVQKQALQQKLLNAKTPEEVRAAAAEIEAFTAGKAAADKNAGIVGSSGVEAADAVRKKTATDTQQNAADAARKKQEMLAENIMILQKALKQSLDGLMSSEQSVEQMKAGFSGMLQIVGVVAKHLGAENFGDSCIELAEKLKPHLVTPNAAAVQAIEDFEAKIKLDPALTQAYIASGQDKANATIREGQADVDSAAAAGVSGAKKVPQPTALDGNTSRSSTSAKKVSSGITVGDLDTITSKLLGGSNPILTPTESNNLHDKFGTFAAQGGNTATIDKVTERASMTAAVQMGVNNPKAQKQILEALNFDYK